MRRVYVLGWTLVPLLAVACIVMGFGGIFLHSETLGGAALFSGFLALVGGMGMLLWADYAPAKPLPRADRKRLREEERRIRLDAEIATLEIQQGDPFGDC